MTKPIVVKDIGGYALAWEQEQIKITVSAVKSHASDGRITGMMRVETTAPGSHKLLHSPSQFNFTATRSRSELAKRLTDRLNHVDWYAILEQCANEIIACVVQGEPVLELATGEDVQPPPWLLRPLLLEGMPTVIFGDRGSAKSTLALAWSQVVQLPWEDNPLDFDAPERPIRTLYLDWEVSDNVLLWQATKIQRGMFNAPFFQSYRRMTRPLCADIEAIRNAITQNKAEVLIIDSLGPAAGGDLNTTQPALDFFGALAQLHVTSLILAHVAKNADTKKRSIYGNGFFENEARNIWEIKALQEPGDDTLEVGLFHTKPLPFYGRLKPFGYKLSFTDNTTIIAPQDPASSRNFDESLGVRTQIVHHISDNGPKTAKELAAELQITVTSVRNATNFLKRKGSLRVFTDGKDWKWALPLPLKTDD